MVKFSPVIIAVISLGSFLSTVMAAGLFDPAEMCYNDLLTELDNMGPLPNDLDSIMRQTNTKLYMSIEKSDLKDSNIAQPAICDDFTEQIEQIVQSLDSCRRIDPDAFIQTISKYAEKGSDVDVYLGATQICVVLEN